MSSIQLERFPVGTKSLYPRTYLVVWNTLYLKRLPLGRKSFILQDRSILEYFQPEGNPLSLHYNWGRIPCILEYLHREETCMHVMSGAIYLGNDLHHAESYLRLITPSTHSCTRGQHQSGWSTLIQCPIRKTCMHVVSGAIYLGNDLNHAESYLIQCPIRKRNLVLHKKVWIKMLKIKLKSHKHAKMHAVCVF